MKQVEHCKSFLDTQPVSSRAKTQVNSLQTSYLKEKGKAYNVIFVTNEEQVLGRKPLKWPPKIRTSSAASYLSGHRSQKH